MALTRKAKQKGIELLNYGRKRNNRDKVISSDAQNNCVICLDMVDVRGMIICVHWFCFVCIHEWSKVCILYCSNSNFHGTSK